MKKLTIAIFILLALLFASSALAFDVIFKNTFDRKMYYIMWWIDHPYDWPGPANMAGGELRAGEQNKLGVDWKPGKYYVKWFDENNWKNRILFAIDNSATNVIIMPEKITHERKIEK